MRVFGGANSFGWSRLIGMVEEEELETRRRRQAR